MANYPRANPARWWKTKSIGRPHRSPHAMFVGRARRWLSFFLLVVLGVGVGGGWYLANPQRISQMAGLLLSRVLGGKVTIKSGKISLTGEIVLSGVRLRTRGGHGPAAAIFSADRLAVRFNWLSLLTGRLRASQLTAIHPVVNLVDDRDTGRWNYQTFLHFHHSSPAGRASSSPATPVSVVPHGTSANFHLPSINLRGAVIRWGRVKDGHYSLTGQSVIDAQLGPVPRRHAVYRMAVQERSVDGASGVDISGRWNLAEHRLRAAIPKLVLSPAFRRTLPSPIQKWWRRFHFHGRLKNISVAVGPARGIRLAAILADVSMRFAIPSRRQGPQIVPILHLSGRIRVGRDAAVISKLTGSILGYNFVVPAASFHGYAANSPFDVRLKLPNFILPRKYPKIFSTRPMGLARAIIYRLRPSGRMDISIHARRLAAGAPPRVHGRIVCHGLDARYAHFPYPFYDVHGLIRFSGHAIHFVNLTGRAEQYPMTLTGLVSINQNNGPIDLHIASAHMMFDRRLGDCLPHNLAPIWNRFNPRGVGHFYCHVVRPAGSTADPDIRIHIFPRDTSGRYVDFPYPLNHVHGELFFANNTMRIIRLTAPVPIPHPVAHGPHAGKIVFTGSVIYHGGNIGNLQPDVRVHAVDIPVNRLLRQSMPRSYAHWVRTFHVRGLAGMDARITRGPNGSPVVRGTLTLQHGRLRYSMLPWPVVHVSAMGDLGPNHLTITRLDGLTGSTATGGIEAAGTVHESAAGRVTASVRGRWNAIDVTGTPASKIPRQWRSSWASLKPQGLANGLFSFVVKSVTGANGLSHVSLPKYHISVQPMKMRLNYTALGSPLHDIQGTVSISPDRVTLHSMEARLDNLHLYAGGTYLTKISSAALSLYATAPDLDPRLVSILPPSARRFIQPLDPHGAWYLTLSNLSRKLVHKKAVWNFSGNLIVTQAATRGWFKTSAANAALSLVGRWDQGQPVPDVLGRFSIADLIVGGKKLNPFSGRIYTDAKLRTITINKVNGAIAGGALKGNIHLNLRKNAGYTANFSLADVRLRKLLSENYPHPPMVSRNSGRVSATLHLTGKLANSSTRRGHGNLTISKADLFNVPLAMGLMQIATLRLPVSHAFSHATLAYTLKHDTVTFSRISLHSAGVNVVGTGTLNIHNRDLNIHMLTESPHGTRLPVIGFIFGLARSQLLQIWVNGTLSHPKVHAVPLRLLSWPFH